MLAPVGIFYFISRRSTQFDLHLDSFYNNPYLLSKLIYRTFSYDYKLDLYKPKINDYKPDLNFASCNKSLKQGIDAELLDQIAHPLIINDL